MTKLAISTEDMSYRKHLSVLGTQMAYVDAGEGDPKGFPYASPIAADMRAS